MRGLLHVAALSIGAFALCLQASIATPATEAPLEFSVHPYLPAAEIVTRFAPLAAEIERATGRKVIVRIGQTYADHVEEIGMDRVDIAYLGPGEYIELVKRYGRKPLLARQVVNGDPCLHGEIIVRKDSPYRSLADLKGRRLAFTDPMATMTILPLAMLRRIGISGSALGPVKFFEGQRNVAIAVLAGDFDGGAVKEELFEAYRKEGLRALAPTPPVDDYLFAARAGLPPALLATLRRVLTGLRDSARGRAAMNAIHPGMTALVKAEDSDYDPLRQLTADAP